MTLRKLIVIVALKCSTCWCEWVLFVAYRASAHESMNLSELQWSYKQLLLIHFTKEEQLLYSIMSHWFHHSSMTTKKALGFVIFFKVSNKHILFSVKNGIMSSCLKCAVRSCSILIISTTDVYGYHINSALRWSNEPLVNEGVSEIYIYDIFLL